MTTQRMPEELAAAGINEQRTDPRRTRFEVRMAPLSRLWMNPGRTAAAIVKLIAVILVASVAAEIFLRLTMPSEIAFETHYTPGAHQPNPKYGFVFTPDYHGKMFHVDNVMNVPLTHDKHGFRPPATSAGAGPFDEVVLIGGASMIYGYGVPHEYTVPAVMARTASRPIKVYNAAWPGFDIYRMFHVYRDFLEPEVSPKLAIICLYTARHSFLSEIPENYKTVPPPPSRETLFRYMDNSVTRPLTGLSASLGSFYYKSYLLARTARFADFLITRSIAGGEALGRKINLNRHSSTVAAVPGGPSTKSSGENTAADAEEIGTRRLVKFLVYVRDYFRQRGTDCIVVIIPTSVKPSEAAEARQFNARIAAAISPNVPCFDLHNELEGELKPSDFLGDSHYGPHAAEILGRRIAAEACIRLQNRLVETAASFPSRQSD
jgi:hypothetical protein